MTLSVLSAISAAGEVAHYSGYFARCELDEAQADDVRANVPRAS